MVNIKATKRKELEKAIKELYDDFQLNNRVKNLSEMTIRYYEQNLVHFFNFAEEMGIVFVRDKVKNIYKRGGSNTFLSVNDLMNIIGVNYKNKEANQRARESIMRLQDMNYITVFADGLKKTKVLNLKPAKTYFMKPTEIEEDSFVKVLSTDIEKIITMQSKHKSKLFVIYLAIVSYLFYYHDATMEHKSVWVTIETLAKISGLDRRTVMKYIKQLHEAEVLFCIKIRVHARKDKNFYGKGVYLLRLLYILEQMRWTHLSIKQQLILLFYQEPLPFFFPNDCDNFF